jgi:hypothetical protein
MVAEVDLLERVPRLVEYLRHYDYRLTVEDELRLLTLSDEVRLRGGSVADIDSLQQIVSPLVCRNPDEQERLPQVLALWRRLSLDAKPPAAESPPVADASARPKWRRYLGWIIGALIAALLLGVVIRSIPQRPAQPTPVKTIPRPTVLAPAQTVEQPRATGDSRPLLPALFALVPLLAAGIIFLRRRRTPSLSRGPAPRDAAAFALDVATAESPLFRPGSIQAALRDLRRHVQIPSGDLDIPRTVAATVRRAGFVQFVLGRRFVLPDYLLLIDRASGKDHFGELGDVLAVRLQAEQFRATRAEYFGDPRRLRIRRSDGSWRQTELARMAADQSDVRLLLVADVADFWDPVRRQWRDWVATLQTFDTVAVLTPIPRSQWGKRERALMEAGFMIVPATSDGLGQLAHDLRLEGANERVGHGATKTERLDALLASDPYLWSGDVPPPAKKTSEMVKALRDALDDAFLYLCALAVFPAINPRLTEQVGVMLRLGDDSPAITDERYGAIARLPWLRRARMPDWVRKALIESMPPDDAARVRAVWVSLLSKEPDSARHGVALEVVGAKPARDALRRLLRTLRRGDDGGFAERILLAFLAGKDIPDLSLAAPGRLGERWRLPAPDRLDGLIALAAVAAAAAALWWGEATLRALVEWLGVIPEPPRILAAPALMIAAAAMAAWHDRIKGGRSLVAGFIAIAALLASGLPLIGGEGMPSEPGVAFVMFIGALGAAAYVFAPLGLRERTLAGIDPLRIAVGDRWWATSLALLSTFGAGAVILGLEIPGLIDRAPLGGDWPAALAANFVLVWLGTNWFQRRLEAPRRLAVVTAAGAAALTAACGALLMAFGYINVALMQMVDMDQPWFAICATDIVVGLPWVVGLGIFLQKAPGRQRLQAILGASALAAMIGASLLWLPQFESLMPGSPVEIAVLIVPITLTSLPIPLIMALCAYRSAGARTRTVATMIFGLGVVTLVSLALRVGIGEMLALSSPAPWMSTAHWYLPLVLGWPMLRWLAPGLAETGSERLGGAREAIRVLTVLIALSPGLAVLFGLVSIPYDIAELTKILSFAVSLAVLVAVFLLSDRIRRMSNRLVVVLSAATLALGSSFGVGYVQFTRSHLVAVSVDAGPPVQYIVPLNPSAELRSQIEPFGGDYREAYQRALDISAERETIRDLMEAESGAGVLIMIALLLLAEVFLVTGVVVAGCKLTLAPLPDEASTDAEPKTEAWQEEEIGYVPMQPIRRHAKRIVTAFAVLIGALATIATSFGYFNFLWPARVEAELTSCQSTEIVLKLTNEGGRRAMVSRPTFTIRSNLWTELDELKMNRIVLTDPFAGYDGIVNPGADQVLRYTASAPFFSEDELQAGGCRISVSVPVRTDRQYQQAMATCRCGE